MDLVSDLQPTLEILDKIVAFEEKLEYKRLLLFIFLAGFVAIIGGWIEFVCYHFLDTDSTFFILGLNSTIEEPVLFLGLWLIYLIPLVGAIVYSSGFAPGFINWNKAYRNIGITIIGLFVVTHVLVLIFGVLEDSYKSQFIPIIWGSTIFTGFLIASRILFLETKNNQIRLGLFIFGFFAFCLGLISSFVFYEFDPDFGMFLFCNIFGIVLIGISILAYFYTGKIGISPQEVKNTT